MADILLVEDDQLISKMLQIRLALQNHKVTCAFDGAEGFEKALAHSYDLILMDMHMPLMDGKEATAKLREQGYRGKIVAVTASVMAEETEAAHQAGCDAVITKPVDEEFEQRIASLLK